jgi:D-sedoheptulose 7-phosphate isomerase
VQVVLKHDVAVAPARLDHVQHVMEALTDRQTVLAAVLSHLASAHVAAAATALVDALESGHKVLTAGNGGSSAEAQHFAAELVGRFKRDRHAYAALALCADTSILTAVANDYGFEQVFARQVAALGRPGDVLLAFSTSGESDNLLHAAVAANERGMTVIAIVGPKPNRLERLAAITVRVPAPDTAITQEIHMVMTHILCDIVETELSRDERDA